MLADIMMWANLILRWLHVITGICWIGSSFYFIWLDDSLEPPQDEKDKKAGVAGEVWAVHGGGFYHKKKYLVAPAHMPEHLHWFKWEAYFTWLSGFLLLFLMYYFGAEMYLIDNSKMALTPMAATLTGLGFIGGGWLFYNTLCQTKIGASNRLFGAVWFAALVASAWALNHIFSGRGAYMHVGAMMGTVMAANVFVIIIPNQKKSVAALLAGEKPDPALGKKAKQRSLHNNYMTLPVLLLMISNHYPALFGNPYNWLILAGLGAAAWFVRNFFNRRHKGQENFTDLFWAFVLFTLVALLVSGAASGPATKASAISAAQARGIIRARCSTCHSDTPTEEGIAAAPQGVMFDKMDEIVANAARIKAQAVDTDAMPPGNQTGMTPEERAMLGTWLDKQSKK